MLGGSGETMKKMAFNMGLLMDVCCLIVELLHHTAFSLEKLFLYKLNCASMMGFPVPWPLPSVCPIIHGQPFLVPYSADLAALYSVLLWEFSKFKTRTPEALPWQSGR